MQIKNSLGTLLKIIATITKNSNLFQHCEGNHLEVLIKNWHMGAWVVQYIKRLTLDFGSGHDLRVVRSRPTSGSGLSAESA